jgi:hypothetical protein
MAQQSCISDMLRKTPFRTVSSYSFVIMGQWQISGLHASPFRIHKISQSLGRDQGPHLEDGNERTNWFMYDVPFWLTSPYTANTLKQGQVTIN